MILRTQIFFHNFKTYTPRHLFLTNFLGYIQFLLSTDTFLLIIFTITYLVITLYITLIFTLLFVTDLLLIFLDD